MAGAQLTQGDAAEAIAAEALSARPPTDDAWPIESAPATSVANTAETRDVFPVELDWSAVVEALPDDVAPLSRDIDTCDPFTLEARMRVGIRALQRIDWQTGRLLRVFLDRRLYWVMQFPSAARYLRERLGMSARKARGLVALERRTWTTPGLAEAYRRGELSWVRAMTILPVLSEETGRKWITRAGEVTLRRLADEVEGRSSCAKASRRSRRHRRARTSSWTSGKCVRGGTGNIPTPRSASARRRLSCPSFARRSSPSRPRPTGSGTGWSGSSGT